MRKVNILKTVVIRWLAVLAVILAVTVIFMARSRPAILSYAKTRAESIMAVAFDRAVEDAVKKLDYGYSDMTVITRGNGNSVSSIEIDYAKLNTLRAEISNSVYDIMAERSDNKLYIPLGTLLGNEYTAGYGPRIKFNISYLQIPRLDFESKFFAAGINNVLHQINIKADLSYSIVMPGADDTFTVEMSAVAAETVIAGIVPDNFTNVIETPDSNVADDIFNFSNK